MGASKARDTAIGTTHLAAGNVAYGGEEGGGSRRRAVTTKDHDRAQEQGGNGTHSTAKGGAGEVTGDTVL